MAVAIGRRQLIAALGSAAGAMPLWRLARGQAIPQLGVLNSISYGPILDRLDAFLERLEADGFVDGQTVVIEYLSAEGQTDWLPRLAAELVRRQSTVIVCLTGPNAVRAAMAATSTIPIVFAISGDPFELGLVANGNRPEANVTGAGRRTEELNPERLKV